MQTLYARSGGTGDGSTIDKAGELQALQGRLQPGGKLLVHAGDVLSIPQYPPFNRKMVGGCYLGPYDGTRFTIRSASGLTFMLSDDLRIEGLTLEQIGRDAGVSGFDPAKCPAWDNALHFINCNRPTLTDVSMQFFGNGIVAESSLGGAIGGTVTRGRFLNLWAGDSSEQGQGIFLAGQSGWLLDDCDMDTVGWDPRVPGTATMFRHGTYSKWTQGSGPFIARRCRFRRCASMALSADTGAEYDSCTVWLSSNVPTGQAGSGAADVWSGGAYAHIHGCTVYTQHVGFLLEALAGDLHDNTIFQMGPGSPIAVGLQKSPHLPAQRGTGDKVNVYSNTAIYGPGVPVPANGSIVNVAVGGPAVVVGPSTNRVFQL